MEPCIVEENSSRFEWKNPFCEPSIGDLSFLVNVTVGATIFTEGLLGSISNATLISIHYRLRQHILDPTGILLLNFCIANFLMCVLQFPFSSTSSFVGSWVWGDTGCQLYAAAGFFLGIGVIYALGVLIVDRYTQITLNRRPCKTDISLWFMIIISWHAVLLFTAPPLLDVFGRYGPEPSGTMCTLDFWHGNFRNYNSYVYFLVACGFVAPTSAMLLMFLKSAKSIKDPNIRKRWNSVQLIHHEAVVKTCGFLFLAAMACWTPYAVLVLWTVVFPPTSLNIYYTLIPPIICKLAPGVNAVIIWRNIPRIQAGYRYLKSNRDGSLPPELGQMDGFQDGDELVQEKLAPTLTVD
ncbi:visual pigment-like receptor peropsin isoform X2 [Eurytemora carolleeae]|uniref:visual pigment-like receptor peropsin isoform X2 n=1 Tax=Eurytemora carolleeae TaxID=1294199 RepID=UPI000C767801|nr:visual pigment-like receptor peropsin isoform X2 [Eurytemora carolleeae]|eukprot:XP_023328583.1 visual pigment-like receptor peropsin isoform X2 [Eurytemora affinis]